MNLTITFEGFSTEALTEAQAKVCAALKIDPDCVSGDTVVWENARMAGNRAAQELGVLFKDVGAALKAGECKDVGKGTHVSTSVTISAASPEAGA